MGFFFTSGKSTNDTIAGKNVSVETLRRVECRACPLNHANVSSPKMEATGTDSPMVYVLGEAPGAQEDRLTRQFVGPSGKVLRDHLNNVFREWIDLTGAGEDGIFRFNNSVRTRPDNNKTPDEIMVECCRPSIERDIERTQPILILACGGVPLNWLLLGQHQAKLPHRIMDWRGRIFPVQVGNYRCWAACTYHPSFVMRAAEKGTPRGDHSTDTERVFYRDLQRVKEFMLARTDPPELWNRPDAEKEIDRFELIDGGMGDEKRFNGAVDYFADAPAFAFDIETASGEQSNDRKLRPYGENARILSISLSDGERTTSIALDTPHARWSETEQAQVFERLRGLFCETPQTKKIAHNLAFELEWILAKLGMEAINGMNWEDTLAQAYVLDSRTGVMSLDILCRIWFGIALKDLEPVDVANLDREPTDKVLRYNGVDAYFTYYLYFAQHMKLQEEGLTHVAQEQVRRIPPFVRAQWLGLPISQDEVKRYGEDLATSKAQVMNDLQEVDAIKEFGDRFGTFNPGSDSDVRKLLRDLLHRKEGYREEAQYSTDESVLTEIGLPVTDLIHQYRQVAKLKSTYIDPLVPANQKFVWPDGKVHPQFKLAFVATRRTSSEYPNIQNQPKRRNKYIRSCFVAPEGHSMVSVDYGQIEARVIAMASKDEYLVKALWNRYDIHREWAEKIVDQFPQALERMGSEDEKENWDKLRQETKNKLVFPAFYGAGANSITGNFNLPDDLVAYLLREFWATFPGVKEWQQELQRFYRKHGYVELLTGFRRYAPLEGNKVINTPIQGTASDIVVDAMSRCSAKAEEKADDQLQPRLNIHDDLTFFIRNEELEDRLVDIINVMLTPTFDFINVPLAVEVESGPDWNSQKGLVEVASDEWFADS